MTAQEPAPKKVNARAKRVKQEDSDDELEPEGPAPKKAKRKAKVTKQEENTTVQATAGKKGKGNAKSAKQEESNEVVAQRAPAPRAAKGKAKQVKQEEAMEDEPGIEDPAEPNGEHEETVEPAKSKRTRKKTNDSQASTGSKGKGKKK